MKMNNVRFHIEEKGDVRTCYHGYQSFDPREELTAEQVHQMGIELVQRLYPNYQVVVATHTDRGHLHNHFVINAVNMDGRKLEDRLANPIEGLYGLRDMSDKIALEHNLKIIEDAPKIGRYHNKKYIYNLAMESWKKQIVNKIDELKERCFSFDDLIEELMLDGYQIKNGKNIKVKPLGKTNYVSIKTLGEDYSEDKLRKFFFTKCSNYQDFTFRTYNIIKNESELLKIQDYLAQSSKQAIILSSNGISSGEYPSYYNYRYKEYLRYNKIVDKINYLNENKIFTFEDLENKINEMKKLIKATETDYDILQSKNEILQMRVPLCELYMKYLDYYESYLEQKEIVHNEVEMSEEVKLFLDIQKELCVENTHEVKEIVIEANKIKIEVNRKYAYLSYLKKQVNELEKLKGMSIENQKGYIKSISFSKRMIDEEKSTEGFYHVRIPYSDLYVDIPKNTTAWLSYNNRAVAYLIDDKVYNIFDSNNNIVNKVLGDQITDIQKKTKSQVNELYK